MDQVFVLKLENDKWYVGHSSNAEKYIKKTFDGHGPLWTQLHKPKEVAGLLLGDKSLQNVITLEYMKKYGINNVRGYAYSARELQPNIYQALVQRLAEA